MSTLRRGLWFAGSAGQECCNNGGERSRRGRVIEGFLLGNGCRVQRFDGKANRPARHELDCLDGRIGNVGVW